MNKEQLIKVTELEKMNEVELVNVKGGVTNTNMENNVSEDSEHHDSNNNDTFEKQD